MHFLFLSTELYAEGTYRTAMGVSMGMSSGLQSPCGIHIVTRRYRGIFIAHDDYGLVLVRED